MTKSDINNRDDIQSIVEQFYKKVFSDPIIGYIFTDVAKVDLQEHIPLITDFWSSSLFGERSYRGNAFKAHVDLNDKLQLMPGHFTRWLYLFNQTVDQNFAGENAELIKLRADMIAERLSGVITGEKDASMNLLMPEVGGVSK